MKYEVDGEIVELESSVEAQRFGKRQMVQTPDGKVPTVVLRRGDTTYVSAAGHVYEVRRHKPGGTVGAKGGSGDARAPMPGQIVEVSVAPGDVVEAGQKLLVLEAMKMQQTITAGISGTVMSVSVKAGDQVTDGQNMVTIAPRSQD